MATNQSWKSFPALQSCEQNVGELAGRELAGVSDIPAGSRIVLYRSDSAPETADGPRPVACQHPRARHVEPVAGPGWAGYRFVVADQGQDHQTEDHDEKGTASLESALAGDRAEGFHVAVLPADLVQRLNTAPVVLVFDVDSTLIQQEVIELLAAHAGREAEVAEVTERAMRGEIDFSQSLHHRVAALAGLPRQVIAEVAQLATPTTGATNLINAAHAHGGTACAVSGGFTQVLQILRHRLGLDEFRANTLEIVDDRLTGAVVGEVVDATVKGQQLTRWRETLGTTDQPTAAVVVAIGDGANDMQMVQRADYGIAFNAKPALRPHADLELDIASLDPVRALLGY
ncbi:phosphoserine phosphatase SerB [Auritidibacter sp. NML130574]|uniref:phosphoserine phosphatase SerB n=1 Tax=Auritidibacter sp. NML130574 TaxID=2170745 RepID=UPI000D728417|nr:phosphoserine phosphatase SerB [Auritidibacter sp. NML130574]AXR73514.1 phosphoserine phosphatase SerB [Auritidibacter sp. NML130574]